MNAPIRPEILSPDQPYFDEPVYVLRDDYCNELKRSIRAMFVTPFEKLWDNLWVIANSVPKGKEINWGVMLPLLFPVDYWPGISLWRARPRIQVAWQQVWLHRVRPE